MIRILALGLCAWFCVTTAQAATRPFCNVRTAKLTLEAMGFAPGEADARLTNSTRKAVKAFQGTVALRRTGELNPPTCSKILAQARALGIEQQGRVARRRGSRLLTWDEIPECEQFRTRNLDNELLLSRNTTRPLDPRTKRLAHALGGREGKPNDLIGVGTYVQITGRGVVLCGVRFDGGALDVTKAGLRLRPGTVYQR